VETPPADNKVELAGERTVLEEARSAIARGDGGAALIAVEAHRDHFANGALVEEREALTVLALAKLGRNDEARAQADRFRARYPVSLFLAAVDEATPSR
jgi:outer membrane protein assembly factor BamD (BamD/ComL family)